MLALRSLLGDGVNLSLVTAEPELIFRPTATAEAFVGAPPLVYDLRAIAADLGATIHVARLESVASSAHYVRLSSGSRIHITTRSCSRSARGRSRTSPGH